MSNITAIRQNTIEDIENVHEQHEVEVDVYDDNAIYEDFSEYDEYEYEDDDNLTETGFAIELHTQEERDEFMELDEMDKAQHVYAIWKHMNGNHHDRPVHPPVGNCAENVSGIPGSWWLEASAPEEDEFDSKAQFRKAKRKAEARQQECITECAQCPLVAQCLTAAVSMPGDKVGSFMYEEDMIYGGTTPDERAVICNDFNQIWDGGFYDGSNLVDGHSRFDVYEDELREELGDDEFERQRHEEHIHTMI